MRSLLGIIAFVLVIFGIIELLHGAILGAILLWVAAAAIGPGGWTIFGDGQ